ncbi:hypothetical protein PAAG_11426 [Paracoccidioides lutzii Pb01]|uniref:Uncharacterized protein n=1 Tax=Paracoccidioides lutzii (strain ATCC MYA-826 / Pb01) TaxID=502779 RepID=A0A0A2V6V6_PARBA|nr:hypothetical protein PAAG_11426 [Paracoccidioides lutzii Pb01]KGQ01850.1 hypothetical protein PAAG_11426 [Paracoccidioides lutzii Pb01]
MFLLKEIPLINNSLILSLVKRKEKWAFLLLIVTSNYFHAQLNSDYAKHTRSGTCTLAQQPQANDKVTTTCHPILENTCHADFAVIKCFKEISEDASQLIAS